MATNKQKKAAEILAENGGNVSQAMKDAGYSDQTAKTPQKLTESKGFRQLLVDAGLDENKLQIKLSEWIDAVKIHSSPTEGDKLVPDYNTQLKAGDMVAEYLGISNKNVQILNQGEMNVKFE